MHNKLTATIINYFDSRQEVVAVYLFGSHASGKEHGSSDIDLGVLLNRNDPLGERRNKFLVDLTRALNKDVHLTILNTAGEELMRQIYKKGICLLVNDPRKLTLFNMVMYAKIADFSFYRRRMRTGFVKSLMAEG